MKREEMLRYLNKIVFLELNGKLFYTCKILDVGEDSFTFLDKFELTATKKIETVESINEINELKILDLFKSFESGDGDDRE